MKKLEEVLRDWEAVIGLEIHAELTTLETKMFCGCKLEFGAEPNTHTCPVCLGLPGALPVPNKAAIESIVLAGLATNCDIEKHSMFYRKNYMYPDMAKNFQTTQGPVAFCMRGHLDLHVDGPAAKERYNLGELASGETAENITRTDDGYTAHVGITRIHMEEDAGKMVHVGGGEGRIAGATHSLVDYNRAGTPLIELVTEPDLRTPEEARLFMQKLRQIYLALGISDCSMEEGSLRCDGNVSLRRRGTTELGTKTELKNMNSFKNLHDGLLYEICRQAEVLEEGGVIYQETRHWDPTAKRTIVMRVKETADDYRLFPEPDLAPYDLSDEWIDAVRAKLPELPYQKAERYESDFGLSAYDARQLVENADIAALFESVMELAGAGASADKSAGESGDANADNGAGKIDNANAEKDSDVTKLAKPVANLCINDIAAYLNANPDTALADTPLTPERMFELVKLTSSDAISSKQAKQVFAAVIEEDKDPATIVEERGMKQVSDTGAIEVVVDEVIAANPDEVARYKDGNTKVIGFFVGQCMKKMRGQGNPKLINETLARKLEE